MKNQLFTKEEVHEDLRALKSGSLHLLRLLSKFTIVPVESFVKFLFLTLAMFAFTVVTLIDSVGLLVNNFRKK